MQVATIRMGSLRVECVDKPYRLTNGKDKYSDHLLMFVGYELEP